MCFKSPFYQAMCLVITAMLHSVTAQSDTSTIDALVDHKIQKIEHKLMEKFQAQNQEVINNITAVQLELQKQLTIVMNDLRHLRSQAEQDKSHDQSNIDVTPTSCATLANNATGTYYIQPAGAVGPYLVRCDFEDNYGLGGGWTVFQHRYDGSVDFYRNWTMYRDGFGDVNAEHWLGLEKLHLMTKSGKHELLIIMGDFVGNTAIAHYNDFQISSEYEKYQLTVENYSGTAGDSLEWHNGEKFSTFDQYNEKIKSENCAVKYRGAWWFRGCFTSHLNGVYHRYGELVDGAKGVKWVHWNLDALKSSKMMLRQRSDVETTQGE